MSTRLVVLELLSIAVVCGLLGYWALGEGAAHDTSGCLINLAMPPPFLGFKYWERVGLALVVVSAGVLIAAVMIGTSEAEPLDH